jgi:hypothetical protein
MLVFTTFHWQTDAPPRPFAQAPQRERLTIRASFDDGNSFPSDAHAQLLVHAGPSAYSSLGTTARGELAVLWEMDDDDLGFATTTLFNARH